jgi:3-carboxy-cis,cis-muconate cycloisomerase
MSGLFSGLFARGPAAAETGARAWLQAMLDFEAALARGCAAAGLIPAPAAEMIAEGCDATGFDVERIGLEMAESGTPVAPMLAALRATLPDDAAACVHRGATSQDVVDTAAMLVARRALAPILADAQAAALACAALAERHRETPMLGRTLLQQAVPITFGRKAAAWLAGVVRSRRELERVAADQIALQFGGAAGTLASLGPAADEVAVAIGQQLGLSVPALPWHAERSRVALLAGALAVLTGSLGKVAQDVVLLAQNEVAEARPASAGGSSAMPHKRNPIAAVAVLACAARTPALAGTLDATMVQEHERAAGRWHAEWEPWSELLRLTGAAAAWSAELLSELEVDGERMRANLAAAGPELLRESGGPVAADAYTRAAAGFTDRALAEYGAGR